MTADAKEELAGRLINNGFIKANEYTHTRVLPETLTALSEARHGVLVKNVPRAAGAGGKLPV
ncbi:MAG: hypothetical protein IPK53_01570 [bacterium]|nr:hypothetical protein [bacterium]